MKLSAASSILFLALALGGCENYYHREDWGLGGGLTTYSDVKQRAVFSQPISETTYPWTITNGVPSQVVQTNTLRVSNCPEAAPDAISALARSGSGNLSLQSKVTLGTALSENESVAAMGLRTQSTELLKQLDTSHCLGYQSGMLNKGVAQALTFNQQDNTLAILAIEQLTGVLKASSPVSVTATATVPNSSGDSPTASDDSKPATATVTTAPKTGKTTKTAKTTKNKPATPADKPKPVSGTVATAGTPTTTTPSETGDGSPKSDTAAVATAVEHIVNSTLDVGFTRDICATVLLGVAYGDVPSGQDTAKVCSNYLAASTTRVTYVNNMLFNVNEYIESQIRAKKTISDSALRFLTIMAVVGSGGQMSDPGPPSAGSGKPSGSDRLGSSHNLLLHVKKPAAVPLGASPPTDHGARGQHAPLPHPAGTTTTTPTTAPPRSASGSLGGVHTESQPANVQTQ